MRLWSIHPKYLDTKGLVALWREGLLAKKVLENKTKGYRNHPQLERFKISKNPKRLINSYLHYVCDEADIRGYAFNRSKLEPRSRIKHAMAVNSGQIEYEWSHLLGKLKTRAPEIFHKNKKTKTFLLNPLFRRKAGPIEEWEVV